MTKPFNTENTEARRAKPSENSAISVLKSGSAPLTPEGGSEDTTTP